MNIYLLSLLVLWAMTGSCVNHNTPMEVEFENSSDIEIDSSRNQRLGTTLMYSEQEAFRVGEYYFDEKIKAFSKASQLRFDENSLGRLQVSDINWGAGWEKDINHDKVVFWSTEHYNSVRDFKLENVDVEDMRGFDFAPLVLQMKNVPPWDGGPFVQHFLHIPGKNRNHWKEGNLEYFFLPDEFPLDLETHLPQFYKYFPDYELPSNRLGMTSFMINDDKTNATGNKGYTYTNSFAAPRGERLFYDYDQWLYQSGAPPAYSVSQEEVNKWLDKVDEKTLYGNFENLVLNKYKGIGHLVLNWEALRNPYGKSIYKLQDCLEAWKSQNPRTEISLWPKGLFDINRVNIESNNFKYQLTDDIKFQGSLFNWMQQRSTDSPFGVNNFLIDNADINYVGGYLNYPTNYGYVHHFVMQHMMNIKFQPEKKSILMWWHNQEYVGNFEVGTKWFVDSERRALQTKIKPMVFPSAMHNAAVWAFAFCDGGELWSEPYSRRNENDFLGAATEVYDVSGNKIKTTFSNEMTGQYAIQNYRNIDRWEGGKWAVSVNKDIIENSQPWSFVSSARKGDRFTQGDQRLPSFSLYEKRQLVALKESMDGTEALLLVYDAWNHPLKESIVNVQWRNKIIPVKVFGRYTSVVRVNKE